MKPPPLTIQHAAELSGRPEETIRRLCARGVLKAKRVKVSVPGRGGPTRRWEIDRASFQTVVLDHPDDYYLAPHPLGGRSRKPIDPTVKVGVS